MTTIWYLKGPAGTKPKVLPAPEPRIIDLTPDEEEPTPVLDDRPDQERVLDGLGEGWAALWELPRVPESFEYVDEADGQIKADLAFAERQALSRIDTRQEAALVAGARLAVATAEMQTWREIQDLKRVTDPEVTAMTAAQRQARWPFLIALMNQSGTAMANFRTFAGTAESELAPRVAKLAILSAKALLARRAVRTATTAQAKLAAAEADLSVD